MKNVKEGYKMTVVGEIPEEWNIRRIDDVFEFSGGLSLSRDKQSDEGVYYLHYGDIHKRNKNCFDTQKDSDWLPKVNLNLDDIKEEVLLKTGDVVFADASEDYEGIGKSVVIYNEKNEPFASGLHTIVAKDRKRVLCPEYKRYCFSSNSVRKQFRTIATGATVYGISKSSIKGIKILIPTDIEQKKIGEILSSVDEQIEITDALIEKTKELKKGLMQKLLTKGIGHTRFKMTEIGEIPEGWKVKRLGDICEIKSSKRIYQSEYVDEGIAFYRGKEITELSKGKVPEIELYINKEKYNEFKEKYGVPQKGDLLITSVGTIGKTWVCDGREFYYKDGNVTQIVNSDNINNYFISYLFDSNVLKEQYLGQSTGSAQVALTIEKLNKLLIPFFDLDEQNKIVQILLEVDEKIIKYVKQKDRFIKLKDGLMQKLLMGKIRTIV